jgi:hypothetical protein
MSLMQDNITRTDVSRERAVRKFADDRLSRNADSIYDSAVIAGNGIGALTFAAQLSKSPRFQGKVTVVAPPVEESRRLIQGVSLRGVAADFISSALGTTHAGLMETFAGATALPVAYRQTASYADRKGNGWAFPSPGPWQGGRKGSEEPLVYGVRNSRVTAGMRQLADQLPIAFVDEKVESADHLRTFAAGKNPILVNATTHAGLLGAETQKPKKMVLAVQAPFIAAPGGITYPLESQTTYAPIIRRAGIINVGYFTPFADPLSPRSSWYGIFARVVDADSGFDKDAELATMTDELLTVADSLGLVADDLDETLGRALVPASPWGSVPRSRPGTLNLRRAYSGGAPCYYADGMVSAAIGGYIGAESIIRGDDPDTTVRKALTPWRRHNFLWFCETNKIPAVAEALLRVNVRAAMVYPHTAGFRMWASAA